MRSLANRLTAIHELSLRLAQLRDVDAIVEAIVAEVGQAGRLRHGEGLSRRSHRRRFPARCRLGHVPGRIVSPPLEILSTTRRRCPAGSPNAMSP